MPLSPGDKLGPYEILAPLGAGGMGEVYKARDTRLDRTVAVKVLPEHIAQREDLRARFEREARAVASLNHPNICTLHDIGPGYMVMELIEGETLAARIEKGALPFDQALQLATQIADALDRAHRAGVTHRDVKPQNIMLTRDGVKVLDFGLAKSTAAKPGPTEETLTKVLTTEGTVLGTPQYMAPEQFEGKEADARSDIWAFGAVLYEMGTGRKAFEGKSYSSLVGAILSADPAPMTVKPFTPSWLERLTRRCLAKDPEERYQSMRDIVLDLRTPPPEAVPAPRKATWLPWAIGAALAVAGIVLAVAWARSSRPPAPRPLAMFDLDIGTEVSDPALSRDGQRIAFVANRQLAYRDLGSATIHYLARTENALLPFFSPDGKSLGYFASDALVKIALDGGAPTVLCPVQTPRGAAWGDDGVIYVSERYGTTLLRASASGGKCEAIAYSRDGRFGTAPPAILPGGQRLLTSVGADVLAVTTTGSEYKLLVKEADAPRFLPETGTLVYHRRGTVYGVRLDLARLETVGTPVALVEGIESAGPLGLQARLDAAGPSGTLVYRQNRAADEVVSWLEADGTMKPLMEQAGRYRHVRFSPDGTRLAISGQGSTSAQMFVYDLARRERRALLEQRGGGRDFPVWSPDGETLVMRADGLLVSVNLASKAKLEIQQATVLPWSFAPDGGALLGTDASTGGERLRRRVRVFPVEKTVNGLRYGAPREWMPLPGDNSYPAVSPDGKWIAFSHRAERGEREVFVAPYRPGEPAAQKRQISAGGGSNSRWGKNELFYCTRDDYVMVAPYSAKDGVFAPGRPRRWSERQAPGCGFDVTPDGKRVAAVVEQEGRKPETRLHVVLNVADELERRSAGSR